VAPLLEASAAHLPQSLGGLVLGRREVALIRRPREQPVEEPPDGREKPSHRSISVVPASCRGAIAMASAEAPARRAARPIPGEVAPGR